MSLRATVRDGRLILDQPTDLPDGTDIDLVVDDGGDRLEPDERAALNAAISRSLEQSARGESTPIAQLLEKLRGRG